MSTSVEISEFLFSPCETCDVAQKSQKKNPLERRERDEKIVRCNVGDVYDNIVCKKTGRISTDQRSGQTGDSDGTLLRLFDSILRDESQRSSLHEQILL